jgi:guanylate cyclase
MNSLWNTLSDRAASFGGEVLDQELRTQKVVIVVLSLSALILGPIWTLVEFSEGDTTNAILSAAIAALIVINFLLYILHKSYRFFRVSQLTIFVSFPFVLHISIGGFTHSANLTWSLATLVIALLSSRLRESLPWFVIYCGLVVAAGIAEPLLFPESGLSAETAFLEFSLNIINSAVIIYLGLLYLIFQKNRAYELLSEEKARSEQLLLNVLPKEIAPILKSGKQIIADRFDAASILFADIVHFTELSAKMDPEETVTLLNHIFSHFDTLVEQYELEKIRTIGDNYMVASGVPRRRGDHAQAISRLALAMADYVHSLPSQNGSPINFRIGINSGPVLAGVIGRHKFQYDLWGNVVNTASRMESQGIPGKIQIADPTYDLIKGEFDCSRRGLIEVKGVGEMNTWFLLGTK